ncbi:hypothetical protein KP79_PYT01247 [Mizuhopecten yessoensis]|uniref:CCHC-type domain-containing protein n=1 Tax=Mizuhopecten yessoensis TaxID=6573 RepID=A0A210QHF8_MIZYE|nr:hypothetical protein KP79_PYT01247 [Mizuhopecten yessoensis]
MKMLESKLSYFSPQSFQLSYQGSSNRRTCYKCKGQDHIKANCKWNGKRSSNPDVQCQICDQFGHATSVCSGNSKIPGDYRRHRLGRNFVTLRRHDCNQVLADQNNEE